MFRVVQCPNCGTVQSTQAEKTFKCVRCNKSKTINPKSKFGLGIKILKSFQSGEAAARFIIEYTNLKLK